MIQFDLDFNGIWSDKDTEDSNSEIDEFLQARLEKRIDYCYDCNTDELYCHAMTFKCKYCNAIILGGCD